MVKGNYDRIIEQWQAYLSKQPSFSQRNMYADFARAHGYDVKEVRRALAARDHQRDPDRILDTILKGLDRKASDEEQSKFIASHLTGIESTDLRLLERLRAQFLLEGVLPQIMR